MGFRIENDESSAKAVERIACEQIDKAIAEIDDCALETHRKIHQVRKRCKKLRGLLRLVRDDLGEVYSFENAWFRDTARELSELRDATSMLQTFEALMEHFADEIEGARFCSIRAELARRRDALTSEQDPERRLARAKERLKKARDRVADWPVSGGFGAIGSGLERTYERGKKALAAAYSECSVESFHEWRKRVKYHRYHARLLSETWTPVMKARRDEAKALSDLLGDDHDLAILRREVGGAPKDFGSRDEVRAFVELCDRRRAELEEAARGLGLLLYAEKPKRHVGRLKRYFRVAHAG